MLSGLLHPFRGLNLLWVLGREGATDVALTLTPKGSFPATMLGLLSTLKSARAKKRGAGVNLAQALKRLGPTYIKLGQIK